MENDMRFSEPPKPVTAPSKKRDFKLLLKKIIKALVIVAILGVIVCLAFFGKDFFGGILGAKSEVYSAVFLANGQVYFGKMIANNNSEIVLNNVFYIQLNDKTAVVGGTTALGQTSFNLVKLGNELHGPTDELFVNKSQVVFYEKLRADSKVVESIKNYKN
jgi:hypothetical protein